MSVPNPYIANGTCYIAAGHKADSKFAPCGNDVFGHQPCCQLGDQCLSSRACYSPDFGTTYIAGCSDPDYKDPSCPSKKKLADEPWLGLAYCNGTSNEWFACGQKKSPPTVGKPDPCFCPEGPREVAFSDAKDLTYKALMPESAGQSIVWQAGFIPTVPPTTVTATATLTNTGSSSSSTTSSTTSSSTSSISSSISSSSTDTTVPMRNEPLPIPTDVESIGSDGSTPNSASSELSQSATVGIAVGISLGSLCFILTVIILIIAHRRHKRHSPAPPSDAYTDPSSLPTELPGQSHYVEPKDPGSGMAPSSTTFLAPYSASARGSSEPSPSELEAENGEVRPGSLRSELGGPDTPASMAEREGNGLEAEDETETKRKRKRGGLVSGSLPVELPA